MSEKNYMLPVLRKWVGGEQVKDEDGKFVCRHYGPLAEQIGMAHAHQIWDRISQAARIAVGLTYQTGPRNPTEEQKERARQLADRLLRVIYEETGEDELEAVKRFAKQMAAARQEAGLAASGFELAALIAAHWVWHGEAEGIRLFDEGFPASEIRDERIIELLKRVKNHD